MLQAMMLWAVCLVVRAAAQQQAEAMPTSYVASGTETKNIECTFTGFISEDHYNVAMAMSFGLCTNNVTFESHYLAVPTQIVEFELELGDYIEAEVVVVDRPEFHEALRAGELWAQTHCDVNLELQSLGATWTRSEGLAIVSLFRKASTGLPAALHGRRLSHSSAAISGARALLSIRLNYDDYTNTYLSEQALRAKTTSSPLAFGSVEYALRTSSYNTVYFSRVDVITNAMGQPVSAIAGCDYARHISPATQRALSLVAAQHPSLPALSTYGNIEFFLPAKSVSRCGWGGLGQLGGRYTWEHDSAARSNGNMIRVHELGHMLRTDGLRAIPQGGLVHPTPSDHLGMADTGAARHRLGRQPARPPAGFAHCPAQQRNQRSGGRAPVGRAARRDRLGPWRERGLAVLPCRCRRRQCLAGRGEAGAERALGPRRRSACGAVLPPPVCQGGRELCRRAPAPMDVRVRCRVHAPSPILQALPEPAHRNSGFGHGADRSRSERQGNRAVRRGRHSFAAASATRTQAATALTAAATALAPSAPTATFASAATIPIAQPTWLHCAAAAAIAASTFSAAPDDQLLPLPPVVAGRRQLRHRLVRHPKLQRRRLQLR